MKSINDYHVEKKVNVDLKNYIYYRLFTQESLEYNHLSLLFAIHDAEIIALAPDQNKLLIYVDMNDDYLIHSYVYNSYIFSLVAECNDNLWHIKGKKIYNTSLISKMISRIQLPFTDQEVLWLHNHKNLKVINQYLSKLSQEEYDKYCRNLFLLKLSS